MCWVIIVLFCHEKCTFLMICNITSHLPSVQSINCKLLVINYLSKSYWLSIDYLFCEVFQRLMLLLEADVKEMNLFFFCGWSEVLQQPHEWSLRMKGLGEAHDPIRARIMNMLASKHTHVCSEGPARSRNMFLEVGFLSRYEDDGMSNDSNPSEACV